MTPVFFKYDDYVDMPENEFDGKALDNNIRKRVKKMVAFKMDLENTTTRNLSSVFRERIMKKYGIITGKIFFVSRQIGNLNMNLDG